MKTNGVGTVVLRASQGGNDNYDPAPDVDQSFVVAKATQSLTFDLVGDKVFGQEGFGLTAASSSGLPVSFSVLSGPATVNGNQVTLTGAGTVVLRASQSGNENFVAAPDIKQAFEAEVLLSLLVNGNGRIERQPDRVSFTNGTIVRLRAVADPGNVFAGWDGASETNSERDVIVVANLQIEANFVPETQPAPRLDFLSTALDSEGFHLQIRGANAVQYEIQSSDDLLDWKPLMVLSGTGSISPFLDPTALTSRFRFYRVKVLP